MFKAIEPLFARSNNKVALFIFLSAILLSPIFLGTRFASSWIDVSWSDRSDIFVISWSCGIISLFISVVYVELFRQSLYKSYLYQSLLFFSLGVSDIVYSLFNLNSSDAIWFKGMGALAGGFILLVSYIEFKKHSVDVLKALFEKLIILCFFLLLLNLLPFSFCLHAIHGYTDSGWLSRSCVAVFYIAGIFFLIGALPWLNSYWNNGGRENLNTGVILLCFGELFLFSRFIVLWTFFWWLWHLLFLIFLLILALYLMVARLRRSFIWKIVLSLALLFSLTMLLSFWAVRKYYDSMEREMWLRITKSELSHLRARAFSELRSFSMLLSTLAGASDLGIYPENAITIRKLIGSLGSGLRSKYENIGYIGEDNQVISFSAAKTTSALCEMVLAVARNAKGNTAEFRIISGTEIGLREGKNMILVVRRAGTTGRACVFLLLEGAFFLKKATLADNSTDISWGKVIFDTRTLKIVYSNLPSSLLRKRSDFGGRLSASLASLSHEAKKKGNRLVVERCPNGDGMIFAEIEPLSGWLVVDYSLGEPSFGDRPLRVHTIAAMSSMLLGIIVMLFMLNTQLNIPLKRLMQAGLSLQNGNFDFRSGSKRDDEIGTVENVFDQTAERLKILYGNLRKNIEEKEEALIKIRKIEKEKRDFFNSLSHELKSPIHSIINFSRFGMTSGSGTGKEYFEKIYENSLCLLNIIEELLQIAKIESAPKAESGEIYLVECIRESALRLSAQAQAKNLSFVFDFKPNVEKIYFKGDRKRLEILFSNLIGNAVKYTNTNTKISISCELDGNQYLIKISDEGPGIPENEINALFQEFKRLPGNIEAGTGLGLYISKKIVEMHNGTIYALNNPERGVCFYITLPVRNEKKA